MAITNTLVQRVLQADANGTEYVHKTVETAAPTMTNGGFESRTLTTTNLTAIALPATTVLQLVLTNTHASARITVTWTPTGGASAVTQVLGPGASVAFWHVTNTTGSGITALSVQASAVNATFDMFLGG